MPHPPQLPAVDAFGRICDFALFSQLLENEVGRSGRRGHVCALLMFEIDDLASYPVRPNAFDEGSPLESLAGILMGASRPGDVVGRTGRSELVLMLLETNAHDATSLG